MWVHGRHGRGSTPHPQQKNMTELQFILSVEKLLAEHSHMAKLYRQYGRVPVEQRQLVNQLKNEVKSACATRRLAIIAERNQQSKQPKQQTLFS